MRIRVKELDSNQVKRIEAFSKVDKTLLENSEGSGKVVSLYFKGEGVSGILNLTQKEAETISRAAKGSAIEVMKPTSKKKAVKKKTVKKSVKKKARKK